MASFTGRSYWQEYDNAVTGDGDFNLLMTTLGDNGVALGNGTVRDHTAWGVPNGPDVGRRALQLEFAGAETVYRSPRLTPAWQTLASGSDAARAQLLDGRRAVAIGLVNLDMVHTPAVELHPVLGLAIQTRSPDRGDPDEAWMVLVRRSGDQGECSHSDLHYLHSFEGHEVRFNLASSYAHPRVDWAQTTIYGGPGTVAPAVVPGADNVLLSIPNPAAGAITLGEIRFQACVPQCAGRCGGDDGCGDPCPATACGASQVCGATGTCQCAAGTTPCPPLGGQCAAACPAYCGDGVCGAGETCTSCPDDCGDCPECPRGRSDCCGDGVCRTAPQCRAVCP